MAAAIRQWRGKTSKALPKNGFLSFRALAAVLMYTRHNSSIHCICLMELEPPGGAHCYSSYLKTYVSTAISVTELISGPLAGAAFGP